jgi:hypothetical protein
MRVKGAALVMAFAALATPTRVGLSAGPDQQQQPQAPAFRSSIALVPIDVRVMDRSGKLVTDLKLDDFTILEDGKRQEVRHFTLQLFTPRTQASGAALALREGAISFELQPNRIFLIVLGRGRLQEPSKAVDAVIRFVGEQLLPQDQVAVFAYNRATTFTADHQRIVALLEKFRLRHERLDFEINEHEAASTFSREIGDIRLTLDASLARTDDRRGYEMKVDLGIDPTKLAFRLADGAQVGRISIAVFCFNEKDDVIASSIQHADLKLSPMAFQKALDSGIPYKVRFPTASSVRRVRAVVYDYEVDLVGSSDHVMR